MREHDISIAGGRRYAEVFEDLKNEGSAGPLKGDTLFGDPQGGACAGLIPRANTGAPLRSIYRAHKDNPKRCNGDKMGVRGKNQGSVGGHHMECNPTGETTN